MICHIHRAPLFPGEALAGALGRPIAEQDVLGDLVVAHSPLSEAAFEGATREWMFADWEDYLLEPGDLHPYAEDHTDAASSLFHLAVRLHPNDRDRSLPEWSQIAHRLGHAAGINPAADGEPACHWVALQARPGRLDVIANLIRSDGSRTRHHPAALRRALEAECRRIESDLRLTRVPTRTRVPRANGAEQPFQLPQLPGPTAPQSPPSVAAQLATLMCQLADETTGPVAGVRSLIEQAAHRLEELPHSYGPEAAQRLGWIARRLYGIQQDLEPVAADLPGAGQRAAGATPAPTAPLPAPARRFR
ncbi:hypothetical protein ACIBAG_27565 [Streptomyces sp. NPDC051243]|uniref:hypothetical protein n=1 Tax=Streptomyces sp. NPDC051243 TaxID=3365646 RepID=UPI00379EE0E9